MPIPFLVLADLRTGSTLLCSSLDRHPEIRRHGELRAIDLVRRDRMAQLASLAVAQATGVFHPHDGDGLHDPDRRPMAKREQERRPLRDVVSNHDEVARALGR